MRIYVCIYVYLTRGNHQSKRNIKSNPDYTPNPNPSNPNQSNPILFCYYAGTRLVLFWVRGLLYAVACRLACR